MFGVGSVYYYCSVVGQVWFTAHVVAVTPSSALPGRRWTPSARRWPGLFVGLGYATRPPWLVFMAALPARGGAGQRRAGRAAQRAPAGGELLPRLARFGVPWRRSWRSCCCAQLGALRATRSSSATAILNVQWQERIQRFGLFNYHFLSRNLAAALVLLPRILTQWPFVKISQHGMSLLVTSPTLAYTVAPAERSRLTLPLWLTVLADGAAVAAVPELRLHPVRLPLQPGLHDLLDDVAGRRQPPAVAAVEGADLSPFAINLFLAIIFDRYMEFTYDDSFFPHGFN